MAKRVTVWSNRVNFEQIMADAEEMSVSAVPERLHPRNKLCTFREERLEDRGRPLKERSLCFFIDGWAIELHSNGTWNSVPDGDN